MSIDGQENTKLALDPASSTIHQTNFETAFEYLFKARHFDPFNANVFYSLGLVQSNRSELSSTVPFLVEEFKLEKRYEKWAEKENSFTTHHGNIVKEAIKKTRIAIEMVKLMP